MISVDTHLKQARNALVNKDAAMIKHEAEKAMRQDRVNLLHVEPTRE